MLYTLCRFDKHKVTIISYRSLILSLGHVNERAETKYYCRTQPRDRSDAFPDFLSWILCETYGYERYHTVKSWNVGHDNRVTPIYSWVGPDYSWVSRKHARTPASKL